MGLKILSHPKSLFYLSATESWERFSFYGSRSFLILYLVHTLGIDEGHAYSTYAAAMALMYATPVLGGFLADSVLSIRQSIILGCSLILLGYSCLALSQQGFHLGLALITLGLGFFKPTLTTGIGNLYGPGNIHRDAGFTLFYFLLNVGAFLGPLACGVIGQLCGWPCAFALSAFGMLIGLFTFLAGSNAYKLSPRLEEKKDKVLPCSKGLYFLVYGGILIIVILIMVLLKKPSFLDYALPFIVFAVVCRLLVAISEMDKAEKKI